MKQTVLMYKFKEKKNQNENQNTNHTHNLRPHWSLFSEKSQKIKA